MRTLDGAVVIAVKNMFKGDQSTFFYAADVAVLMTLLLRCVNSRFQRLFDFRVDSRVDSRVASRRLSRFVCSRAEREDRR